MIGENSGRGVLLRFNWDTGRIRHPHIVKFSKGGKNMKKYRIIYTIATEIEADNHNEALDIASELDYDDFAFVDAEVEEIEEVF